MVTLREIVTTLSWLRTGGPKKMNIYQVDEDGGGAFYYIVAEDEPQARGIMAGSILAMGVADDCCGASFDFKRVELGHFEGFTWWDGLTGCSRPAAAILAEQQAKGPGLVAGSEW